MATTNDIQKVVSNINGIYERRKAAVYALCVEYAAMAIQYFWSVQPPKQNTQGQFWYNRSGQASARMKHGAYIENNIIAWFLGHGVQYGVYLELANDARHQSIRPIIQRFAGRFWRDLQKLYGDEKMIYRDIPVGR